MPLFSGESDDATRLDEQNPGPQGSGFSFDQSGSRTQLRLTTTVSSNAGGGTDQTLAMPDISIGGRSAKSSSPWLAPERLLGDGVGAAGWRGQKLFAVKCGRLPAHAGRDRAVVSASLRPSPCGSRPCGLPSTDVRERRTSTREGAGAGVGQAPMFDHTLHHLSPVSLRCAPVSKVNELRRASSR